MNFEHEWIGWNWNFWAWNTHPDTGYMGSGGHWIMVFCHLGGYHGALWRSNARHGDGMSELCLSSLSFFLLANFLLRGWRQCLILLLDSLEIYGVWVVIYSKWDFGSVEYLCRLFGEAKDLVDWGR